MMKQKDCDIVTAAFESGLEYRDFLISHSVAADSAPAAREKAFQRILLLKALWRLWVVWFSLLKSGYGLL